MGHISQQSAHIGKARQASQPQREPVDKGLLIGIRYEKNDAHQSLEQSHNDVQLMKSLLMGEYIFEVYGSRNWRICLDCYQFSERNIEILADDEEHTAPTRENIVRAYFARLRLY